MGIKYKTLMWLINNWQNITFPGVKAPSMTQIEDI